jgi:hypothetical protein
MRADWAPYAPPCVTPAKAGVRNDEIGLILPSQQALDVRRYYFRRWPFDPLEEQIGAV